MKKIFILIMVVVFTYSSKKASVNQDKSLDQHCVKCHIMYYPEFLPQRSWEALFKDENLKNHFDESVVLQNQIKQKFLKYYINNSSDKTKNKLAKKVNRSIPSNKTPIRLTNTPYHKDKHEDLRDEMVLQNDKVKSYANCKACHDKGYDKGIFEEDDTDIPHWTKGFLGWKKK
jgi:nitrate/TMAO reductase-like tetraheme cytochrome c subunit